METRACSAPSGQTLPLSLTLGYAALSLLEKDVFIENFYLTFQTRSPTGNAT